MEIRDATAADREAIRSIARASLRATYTDFLAEDTIEDALEQWYGEEYGDHLEGEHSLVLVVERDGEPVAISECEMVGDRHLTGRINWLHVDPAHRGEGTGVRLLVRTRERLLDDGAERIEGVVLADNAVGAQFYTDNGFERASEREIEIADESFTEEVYVEAAVGEGGWGTVDELTIDDQTILVSYGEATRGADAPFYRAYETEAMDELYGWYCGACDSLDNSMDTMGRIQCNSCGNRRKPTRWDSSYL